MPMKLPLLVLFVSLVSVATAQDSPADGEPVQMAPVSVTAGPLGFLGIKCDVDVDTGFFGHVSNSSRIKGMVVVEVKLNSPAQIAGMEPGDRVLQIDGTPITDYTFAALKGIREKEKGDKMVFVARGAASKAPRTVKVTVGTLRSLPR
jgi:C-terminal processing protease CtpA/Prc